MKVIEHDLDCSWGRTSSICNCNLAKKLARELEILYRKLDRVEAERDRALAKPPAVIYRERGAEQMPLPRLSALRMSALSTALTEARHG